MTAIYFTNLFVNFEGENERKKKKRMKLNRARTKITKESKHKQINDTELYRK